ncbi:ferritin-like domain-containing protein [Halobellus rarus]|uniref:Ferritin-like domain-containing protein n=1 Tax=Halobellus rarus TaxID=1126237 RepID=A0ABD6CMK3_9EURY
MKEQLGSEERSRRSFLARSAIAGGSLLALGGATGSVLGQEDGDSDDGPEEMTASFDDVEGTDLDVLNYALSLEHLENAFYREGLEMFSVEDFVVADSLESYDEERRMEVYDRVETIAEHESTHVDVLTQAIELLGGTPVEEDSYNFGVETVGDFLGLGQVLENTGVAAYAGAAPFVESPDLLSAALSIHSVEARHAALLNEVNGESPFPDAFDSAQSQQEVLDAIEGLIESDDGEDGDGGGDGDDDDEGDGDDDDEGDGDDDDDEQPTTPGNETATPGNETATPGDETATPGNETTTPGNETATPGNTTE